MPLAQPKGVGSTARGVTPKNRGGGTSSSTREFVRKQELAAQVFANVPAGVNLRAARILADQLTNAGRRAGIRTFAGRPWRGWKVAQSKAGKTLVRPYNIGATSILNSGAVPHVIGPRAMATRAAWRRGNPARVASRAAKAGPRSGGPRAIFYSGLPRPVAYVRHPGMDGKFFVQRGLKNGIRVAGEAYNTLLFNELGSRVFK